MVQPIEYTPQFIKTDVGAIQDKLNARQGQYDTAYAGTLGAEDQFGQFDVHARDIDLKNKIIGGFKDRVKSIVDQYGGDYAAASKQLVKEIVNTKGSKFFDLAARRNKYAEEQRRMQQQFGPGAITIKDVTKPDLMDAQGNWIKPEDLVSDVISRKQLTDILDEDYQLYKNKSREANVKSDRAGYYKSITTQGITNNEVGAVRDKMFETLKKNKPELSDDMAMNIADAQARSYVLGSKSDYLSNKEWDEAQRKASTPPPPPPPSQVNLFDKNVAGKRVFNSARATEYGITRKNFETNAKNIDNSKIDIANISKAISYEESRWNKLTPQQKALYPNGSQRLTTLKVQLSAANNRLLNSRNEYNTSLKKIKNDYPIYKDFEDKFGLSKAIGMIGKLINTSNEVFPNGISYNDVDATGAGLVRAFSNVGYSTSVLDKNGKSKSSGKSLVGVLKTEGNTLNAIRVDPNSGIVTADISDKDGNIESHSTTIESTNNAQLKTIYNNFKAVKDVSNGRGRIGYNRIDVDKHGKSSITSTLSKPKGDGKYAYNKLNDDGTISTYILNIKNGKQLGYEIPFDKYSEDAMNQMGLQMGVGLNVKEQQIVP